MVDRPIKSILDQDLYKLSMQQAVLELYPNTVVEYRFTNRGTNKFNTEFFFQLNKAIYQIEDLLRLKPLEFDFLEANVPYLKPQYLEYLYNYQFDPDEVHIGLFDDNLDIVVKGPWHSTILWEVPLMAMISELYFKHCDIDWHFGKQAHKAISKSTQLEKYDCHWADFGTRRRRCYDSQVTIVEQMRYYDNFVGTSNVHLAHKFNVKPIGTMAHEWIMGVSALEGLRHANRFALEKWHQVYKGNLGIALTDTYGSQAFWNDFDSSLARLYDGVRHDSGNPFEFADDAVEFYKQNKIDPLSKVIVFSDSLNVDKAIELQKHCKGRIGCSFGIGTHFTNDFQTPALNMVIKLYEVDGIKVAKLSDDEGKAQGHPDAVKLARHIFQEESL